MKNMRAMLFLLFVAIGINLSAQSITLSGNVKDTTGEPVIGASILEKGTTNGTITDFDGNFNLTVGANATVVVSYIGMKPQDISVKGKTRLDVTLQDDATALEEVVVIGYGTVKRKDLTGSVASVGADAIAAVPVASAVEAISGKLAGVQITTTEGSPDAEMKIRVRGGGSITGDNTPLYIVDGFPVESINDIAPSDIESIDVLKDASSTAIYGSRGANGVIIVTTKSGKEGKISINYNAYVGWKKIAKTLDVLSPYDYASWNYERALLANELSDYTDYFGNYQDMDLYKDIPANDWQEQIFGRTGFTFNHNLSISGGSEKIKYNFSYNHMNDKAIMQMSGFKRDNLSLKLNSKPNKSITLDFSIRYSNTEIKGGGANEQNEKSSADSRLKDAMIYTPFPVAGLSDNSGETDSDFNLINPHVKMADNDRFQERKSLNMNGGITWEIIKGLRAKAEVGLDEYRNIDNRFYGSTTYYVQNTPATANKDLPAIIFANTDRHSFRSTNTLSYDFSKLLPESHNLNVLAGQEYVITKQQTLTSTIHGLPSFFDFDYSNKLSTEGTPYSIDNNLSPDDKLFSFFGRVNYDFESKYIASATFRADGSSKFSEGNRWGYFPSAAVAWRISAEPFMEKTENWLDDLKLRFSYGTAGNNNIPSGQMAQSFSSSTTAFVNGYTSYWSPSKVMANPDLKWETTVTRNLGLDITTLGGRLSGTFEVYKNNTKDLLIQFPTIGTGYDSQYRNMGETQNTGFEATVNWVILDKKNYGLSFSGNIGFNKNKIVSLGQMSYISGESGWASTEIGTDYWIEEGGSIGRMYGYRSDGRYEVSDFTGYNETTKTWTLDPDKAPDASAVIGNGYVRPGAMKLKDLDGDGDVDTDDREIIGDANPLHTGGFTINGRLYGFDLSANFNWSYGNDIYNANKIEYTSTSKYHSRNMISEMATGNRWTNLRADGTISNDATELAEMNKNTSLWSPYMQRYVFSDWAVEDGSFLRLSTLTLGYTLPRSLVQKVKLQNCRFYVSGYNVFCWTNYSGFDPEVSTRRKTALTPGVDYSAYPKSRSIVFGLNLNF